MTDTGLDVTHPEFAGRIARTYDTFSRGTDVTDTVGHGTFVTGLIAAVDGNGVGGKGVAGNTQVFAIRGSQGRRLHHPRAAARHRAGHGNHYLARVLGEAAVGAARTESFLGARYRRLVRRRGKKKAVVAVGRSLLVIIWHLLAYPEARFHDLGTDFYDRHVNTAAKRRNHIQQLEALGYKVTLEPAA